MDSTDRIEAASSFLLQSPPGEINDVLNGMFAIASVVLWSLTRACCLLRTDVRNIISDDESLQEGVLPALVEYNLAQFTTVDVPGTDHQV